MNSKRLLRFYFKADDLERALDNLITSHACRSADCTKGGEYYAERILGLIAAKGQLAKLWQYLDGVMSGLKEGDVQTLKSYALSRSGIRRLDSEGQRAVKRAVIKFVRHARGLDRFAEGTRIVGEYYCLI